MYDNTNIHRYILKLPYFAFAMLLVIITLVMTLGLRYIALGNAKYILLHIIHALDHYFCLAFFKRFIRVMWTYFIFNG